MCTVPQREGEREMNGSRSLCLMYVRTAVRRIINFRAQRARALTPVVRHIRLTPAAAADRQIKSSSGNNYRAFAVVAECGFTSVEGREIIEVRGPRESEGKGDTERFKYPIRVCENLDFLLVLL